MGLPSSGEFRKQFLFPPWTLCALGLLGNVSFLPHPQCQILACCLDPDSLTSNRLTSCKSSLFTPAADASGLLQLASFPSLHVDLNKGFEKQS